MIIGIGGKMGSGKNLVCDIIQYFTSQDVSPDCIKRIKEGLPIKGYHNSKFEQKSFAGKLKTIGSLLTGIPVEKFEDQEFKKTYLPEQWDIIIGDDNKVITREQYNSTRKESKCFFTIHKITVRQFLQNLGTEAMRDGLHTNVWVNALFADYTPGDVEYNAFYPNWIITDMRFPNEMQAVKERNGITIRVVRPHGYTNPHTGEYKEMPLSFHPSETALDDAKFDYEIINDGTIEELIEKVREILIKEKII